MLRKGIVALMISVMSVGGLQAADRQKSATLMDFIRGPAIGRPAHTGKRASSGGGVRHAVVADAEKQVPEIRQTSSQPQPGQLQPAESAPQPLPVQYAPVTAAAPQAGAAPVNSPTAAFDGSQVPVEGAGWQQYPQAGYSDSGTPVSFASSWTFVDGNGAVMAPNGAVVGGPMPGGSAGPGSLYPAPRPGIPHQVGGTAIVHQALHPHEMLYPHRYKAMYGPYYYKVHGGWIVTPFGVWSKENWKLKGTTVDVKYKSHISKLSGFCPPVIR